MKVKMLKEYYAIDAFGITHLFRKNNVYTVVEKYPDSFYGSGTQNRLKNKYSGKPIRIPNDCFIKVDKIVSYQEVNDLSELLKKREELLLLTQFNKK